MIYEKASKIAARIIHELSPMCELIDIGGSIRRQCSDIGDIEIICYPHQVIQKDMFGAVTGSSPVKAFCDWVNKLAAVKGECTGRYTQRHVYYKEIHNYTEVLDLFMPQRDDYYRQLAIRTGSLDFCKYILAPAWVKLGWVGTEHGLRRRHECEKINGKWQLITATPSEVPPVWKDEQEFFDWLGLVYVPPQYRNYPLPEDYR